MSRRRTNRGLGPERYQAHAWGLWWCFVNGWVAAERLRHPMHLGAASILRDVQPGVVLYEVSA